MIRLFVIGALALFAVGCSKTDSPSPGGTPPAAVATDAKSVFELGQDI